MNNTDPLVSIVIPVYNGSNYMRQAIDSALGQTYKNIEVIVVNDGSSDGGATEKIALSYGDRIRYIRKENGGVSTALNAGIRAMRGKYFSWLSHDDVYTPEKIQVQVQQLERYPQEKLIALCGSRTIDKDSTPLKNVHRPPALEPDRVIDWKEALHSLMVTGAFFGCALMIPKETLESCGLFDERMRFSQDHFMWMKIFLAGYSLIYSDKVCAFKRRHKEQQVNKVAPLFYQDNEYIAAALLPDIAAASRSGGNVLYWFACSNARYNLQTVVRNCIALGRENGLLSATERLKIYLYSTYGMIRPLVRAVYRKLNRLN